MMEGQPYTDFVSDIHTHGLRDRIDLFKRQILDGRNFYKACLEETIPEHGGLGISGLVKLGSKNMGLGGMNLRKLKQPHNRIHTLDHFLDAHSLYGDQRDRARDWR